MNKNSKKVAGRQMDSEMDSLTNFSQTSKIVIIHLEKEEIPCGCITLRFFTHVQASALFSAF